MAEDEELDEDLIRPLDETDDDTTLDDDFGSNLDDDFGSNLDDDFGSNLDDDSDDDDSDDDDSDDDLGDEDTEPGIEEPYESILIVEDGTGLPNANSYVSLDFADDYLSVRSETWDEYTDKEKETALICATDFINSVFQWKGKKSTQEQSLAFPRTDLVDLDGYTVEGVPLCLKQAVCDCADLVSTGTELFQTHEANGDVVSERIGELAFTYNKAKSEEGTVWNTLYDSVNAKLRGLYVDKSSNNICWSRIVK